jgi:anaerobic selenocysteine-containing dehydrogenase
VHVATKLNRTHLLPGQVAYLLPCLGRIEIDRQASGAQTLSVEDSTGFMHASDGVAEPADAALRSELWIIASIAQRLLEPNPKVPWAEWIDDYARVRDAIEATWPEVFRDFNRRFREPGGFHRPIKARHREWSTETKKANFVTPDGLVVDPDTPAHGPEVLRLMTMRSDDQFNTTIYSLDDRFRGVYGTRRVLLMNAQDIARLGLAEGTIVRAVTCVDDGIHREVDGLRVTPHDIPLGCAAGYYPECNPLIPLAHHAEGSKVPASKSVPVRLEASVAGLPA